jgi:signal transduction histidine kinase
MIQIAASKDSSRIRLEVLDDGPGFSLDAITPEHGLGNLIARLELLFGGAGQLEVTREKEKTVVRLSFPHNGNADGNRSASRLSRR